MPIDPVHLGDQRRQFDRHARCPQCEYDLYGQTLVAGLIRCPECGQEFSPTEAIRAGSLIREKRSRASLALLAGIALCLLIVVLGGLLGGLDRNPVALAAAAAAALGWMALSIIWIAGHRRLVHWPLLFIVLQLGFFLIELSVLIVLGAILTVGPCVGIPICLLAAGLAWLGWRSLLPAIGWLQDGHDLIIRKDG